MSPRRSGFILLPSLPSAVSLDSLTPRHLAASTFIVALLTTGASTAQDRATLVVLINGEQIPSAAQPRVVLEQQYGVVDQGRIRLTGTRAIEYARTISLTDPVAITVRSHDGAAVPIFSAEVASLERAVDQGQPAVIIHAASAFRPTVTVAAPPLTIGRDGSGAT